MISEKTLIVSAIKEGTVIDHIQAGQALKIIRLLRLNDQRVTLGLNLKSRSMKLKDLIKIEDVFLTESQSAQIALFSPNATVNVIRNYELSRKFKVQMPSTISSVLSCGNPRCVTHAEKISTLFTIEENGSSVILRCKHCEKIFSRDQMQEKL